MAGSPGPSNNPLPLFNWLISKIDLQGLWGRWRAGAPANNEGGVDLPEPGGTPIYALGTGPLMGWGTFTHPNGNPGYGVLTQQVNVPGLGKANVYYQHIDLLPVFKACKNGQCGGQMVNRGQLIGYTRANVGELEVGINPGWGGIWAGNTAPGPWITDPRPYLKALAVQGDGTGVPGTTGSNAPGQTGTSAPGSAPDANGCTPPSNALDVGGAISYAICNVQATAVNWGEHIAVFLIGLLLIGVGIYILGHNQINAAVGGAVKKTAKAGEEAALL